jgi:hypothetical protein
LTTPAYYYSNVAVSNTIGNPGGISNSATSVYCASAPTGFPTQFPFKLVLGGAEIVSVTAGSGTSGTPWTIVRAQDGTAASAWAAAASIQHMVTAGDLSLSRTHEASQQAQLPHGLPTQAWLSGGFSTLNETVLANSTTNLVTFSSIPGTFKHLLVLVQARLTETTIQSDDILMQVNGDSSNSYSYVTVSATNISGSTTGALSQSQFTTAAVNVWPICRVSASLAGTAVNAGGGFAFIPNYSSASFNKSFYGMSGMGNGTGAPIDFRARMGFYNPGAQAAITSLSLAAPAGSKYLLGSTFCLYAFG